MADSILRLKVESQEYDNKLKQATNGLTRYVDECRKVGGTLEVVEKETLDYVRALGQMDTTSRTATGKLAEMKKAFVELSAQYKRMSDAEKNSPVGKALAQSLDELKPRIMEAKQQLDDINKSISGASSIGSGLFGEGGLSGMLQVFGGNMLTKAAGAVASLGTEMMETAKQSVELAKQGDGVRLAFERLNNPGLLANLKEATHGTVSELELMKAAVKFDDFKLPVEELGILLQFAQKKASDTGQSVDYMVDSIVTGLGRKSLMILDNLGLSASQVKDRMAETGDMTKAVADIIREEMEKSGGYVETAATRAARATAQAQDKMMELGRAAIPVAEAYNEAWGEIRIGAMSLMTTVLVPIANFLKHLRAESNMTAEDILTKGMTDVTDTVDDNGRLIRKNAISSIPEVVVSGSASNVKKQTGGSRSGGFNISSIAFDQNKAMLSGVKAEDMMPSVAEMVKPENILGHADEWEKYKDTITGTVGSVKESFSNLTQWTEDFDPFQESMDKMNKSAMQSKMAFGLAANAAGALGGALAGMEDPGVRAAGIVLQSIASIAMGFAQAAASPLVTGTGWGWLAFVAAGVAAMATTISTIHQLTGFAEGGIVGGNSYSGDNIYGGGAMVNSGELVLNKAQQGNLASQLQGNGINGMNISGRIKGTDIILSVDRSLQLQGKQLLTWG